MKVNFGCWDHPLEGWTNHDLNIDGVDIRQPLPYSDKSVNYIQCEHVLEHLTSKECIDFLGECRRILAYSGVLRISVPALDKIAELEGCYDIFIREESQLPVKGRADSLRIVASHWGHKTVWTTELLKLIFFACDFTVVREMKYGHSFIPELDDIDRHATHHYLNEYISDIALVVMEEAAIFEVEK